MTLSQRDNDELRHVLRDAVVKCSERCLYQSAKWAAELLNSLPEDESLGSPNDTEVDSPMDDDVEGNHPVPTGVLTQNENNKEAQLEAVEVHKYLMAKTYFDCREYDRCAAVFLPMTLPKGNVAAQSSTSSIKSSLKGKGRGRRSSSPEKTTSVAGDFSHLSQKALFLALYAKYMSGEKRKEEDSAMILGPSDDGSIVNRELVGIGRALDARFKVMEKRKEVQGQGWLEYLYGIVLAKGKDEEQARVWLLKSVNAYPFNWGAWQELGLLLSTVEDLAKVIPALNQNIMSFIFHVYQNQELFQHQDVILKQLETARSVFPTSMFLEAQKALLYYHAKDFQEAESIFSHIIERDPLRIDDLDIYSNILYVMEKRPQLAFLAQLTTAVDKFRPETCCVVGNYYAMKSEHEKAVVYFRRALTLDRSFLAAWTLMGHEFVELKNTQAAIECYRRAVDVNRKDYRAWYGLGQAYEVLDMHFYALFYYQRAASLSPYDPKMWAAVGSCLARMERWEQAVKAYKRALMAGTYFETGGSSFGSSNQGLGQSKHMHGAMDPEILFSIACMYDKLSDVEETKAYLELVLVQEEGANAQDDEGSVLGASITGSIPGVGSDTNQGVGVTVTTSKARMWLARMEFEHGGKEALTRALALAEEMQQDGYEVEVAKALAGEIRAKMGAEKRTKQG